MMQTCRYLLIVLFHAHVPGQALSGFSPPSSMLPSMKYLQFNSIKPTFIKYIPCPFLQSVDTIALVEISQMQVKTASVSGVLTLRGPGH